MSEELVQVERADRVLRCRGAGLFLLTLFEEAPQTREEPCNEVHHSMVITATTGRVAARGKMVHVPNYEVALEWRKPRCLWWM